MSSAASVSRQPPSKNYKIGDKLEVIVPHCDPVVNEYDQMYGIRGGKVEVVWDVTATRDVRSRERKTTLLGDSLDVQPTHDVSLFNRSAHRSRLPRSPFIPA